MKANRKFRDGEEAVSAVIGVILMVAITVAIAATVYVYVSGMIGTGTESAPTLTFTKTDTTDEELLTVVSADPSNLDWGDLTVIVNGVELTYDATYISGSVDAGDVLIFESADYGHDSFGGSYTGAPTADYTVVIRHDPTNTLTNEFDFTGQ